MNKSPSLDITVLGCGTSGGVPFIGCDCAVCRSPDPRNRRSRVSLWIQYGETHLLIDSSPDFREQALRENIPRIDAVLYTHDHADHVHGIDDLRAYNYLQDGPIDCYADAPTLADITRRFGYIFTPKEHMKRWYKPALIPHEITPYETFHVGGLPILPFFQHHGPVHSLGFRIGDFAYSTDVRELPEDSFRALEGVKLWIVDCLQEDPSPTHSHLAQTLEWIARLKPERAFLTHMNHRLDYTSLKEKLPAGVEPAYDGLRLTI